jgi:perosamine synthetase
VRRVIRWAEPDIGEEEVEAVKEAVKSTWISGRGPQVAEFEDFIRRKIGVKHAIAVNNGTSALLCALQAFREKLGSLHILVPTLTYLATVNTSCEVGKSVGLVDCSRDTWNVDKKTIEDSQLESTNLIIPVDIAGMPVDYDELKTLNVPIIADSAQAIGARYKEGLLGSQADVHIFSFHAAKTITAGEGGLITTNDSQLYDIMNSISNQGYPPSTKDNWNYYYERIGFNYRMPNLQAALALAQIKKLDRYVEARAEHAKIYKDILGDLVGYQKTTKRVTHPYFIFGILIDADKQQAFCKEMVRRGIGVKVTFIPAHKLPFYHSLEKCGYPNSEWVWHHVVSLPIHNKMSEEDVIYVAETTKVVLSEC